MDKSKIVPEIHRYMVCDLQAPMMLSTHTGNDSRFFSLLGAQNHRALKCIKFHGQEVE